MGKPITNAKTAVWSKTVANKEAADCLISGTGTEVFIAPCTGEYKATREQLCNDAQFKVCLAEDFNPTYDQETEDFITCCYERTVINKVTASFDLAIACAECYDDGSGKPNIQTLLTQAGTTAGSPSQFLVMVKRADGVCLVFQVTVTGYSPNNTKTVEAGGFIYNTYSFSAAENFEIYPKDAKFAESIIIKPTDNLGDPLFLADEFDLLAEDGSSIIDGAEAEGFRYPDGDTTVMGNLFDDAPGGLNLVTGGGYGFGTNSCPVAIPCSVLLGRNINSNPLILARWITEADVCVICEGVEYPVGTVSFDPDTERGTTTTSNIVYDPTLIAALPVTLAPCFEGLY